jgi:hypothetical protein
MIQSKGFIKVIIHADHRNGICESCNTRMKVVETDIGNGKLAPRAICPNSGGNKGQLIARPCSVQPPDPPQCLSLKCLGNFMKDSLFVALLSSYHRRRVAYAEANRPEKGKKILERYRTGENPPKNLWQAIHANLKLTCPICRKYNVDPLLFGGK